jgi:hypothetical protein
MVENRCTTQGVQIAVGVEAEIMGTMVPVGKLLAGIAQGLEMSDGVWVLERGQRWDSSSSIHSASFDTASSCRVDLDSFVVLVAMTVQKAAQSHGTCGPAFVRFGTHVFRFALPVDREPHETRSIGDQSITFRPQSAFPGKPLQTLRLRWPPLR